MTKLPEPACTAHKNGMIERHEVVGYAIGPQKLYTEAQLLQFRRDVLEEAAMVCDEHLQYPSLTPKHCADHLRALKDEI